MLCLSVRGFHLLEPLHVPGTIVKAQLSLDRQFQDFQETNTLVNSGMANFPGQGTYSKNDGRVYEKCFENGKLKATINDKNGMGKGPWI